MASLFLSYDHQDAARAAPIAQALERAGHAVWWDRNIHGGAEYNDEIEGALNRADAILVLWSKRSVKSPWVRDEAAVGRDRGRLIPVLLDKTDPPLGFRQFQNINLSSRPARQRTGELEQLMAAIARLEGAPTAEHRSSNVVFRPRLGSGSRWPVIAAMAAAALLITAFAGWRLVHRNAVPIVAVAAADSSSTSQALARDLLVKLGTLQASDAQALQLASQDGGGRHSSLVFSVAARTAGTAPEASLALFDGKQQMLLWSADITRSSGSLADLKQQLAYTAAQVLKCATEGLSSTGRRLDQVTLKIYLSGCASAADSTEANSQDLLRTFLQVTRRAPDFAGGWKNLILAESEYAHMTYLPESAKILAALPAHIIAARRVDPNMPEAYLAEAALRPQMAFGQRIALIERAVAADPDNGAALTRLSDALLAVGLMNEAVESAERSVRTNPLDPSARDELVAALTYAGKMDAAMAEVRKAEQLWPGTRSVISARYLVALRYGDPREAMRLIRSGQVSTAQVPYVESFLEARIDPTSANIERAVADARSWYERHPTTIYHYAQVLGTFGREADLFPILLDWPFPDKVSYVVDALFRPSLEKFRSDPRMMAVAKRLGLLDYWRQSGLWPDFCYQPDLPYDCKAEAAKLG